MPKYVCDPNLELQGNSVQALLGSITHENYLHILEERGLDQIDPQGWYRWQDVLEALEEIAGQSGGMMDLVGIGMAAADLSLVPPEVEEMPPYKFFELYEQLYPKRWRNGDPGWIETDVRSEQYVVLNLYIPFPDDLSYGLFYGFAKRFSHGARFTVQYDDSVPRKDQGGETTLIHIIWK